MALFNCLQALIVCVFIIIVAFEPWTCVAQDLVYSLPTQQSTVERGQLSSSNGDVFVGAGGTLYRLSSELQQLQNVSVPDSVLGLTTTADGDYLVACFTDRRCVVYDTTTLNTVAMGFGTETFGSGITVNNVALFTAPLSGNLTFFLGFGEDSTNDRFRLFQRGFAGSNVIGDYVSPTSTSITRQIYGGFVYGSNAYFLALDTEGASTTMYIIRVCNDGQLAARYELQLTCGGTALSSSSVITGVSEVDGTLVVSVDGRVCSYNLTTIDTTLDNFFTSCLDNEMGVNDPQFGQSGACSQQVTGGNNNQQKCLFIPGSSFQNLVLNSKSASNVPSATFSGSVLISEGVNTSLAISVEGNLFLFVATANSVEKHLFTAGSSGTTLLYSMAVSSPVTALSWSPPADYVYATVGNQVVRFPLETCSSSTTCSSCVTNSDPLCGWCSVESKCSRRSQCQNNTETMRYLAQGANSSCTNTVMFDPPQFVSGIESVPYQVNISFTPGSLPPTLPGETFLCVFSNEERGITFNTTLSRDSVSCDLTSSLPALTNIKLVTRFSLYSTLTKVTFFSVENGYTFYNCSLSTSCRGCVETDGNCGWCLYDFSCTGRSQDCSVADSSVNLTSSQNYTDVCPVLSPPASSDSGGYVQPVNVDSPLIVTGSNLPSTIGSVQYMCRFGSTDTMAQLINPSTVRCTGQVSLSDGVSDRENRTFELVLINGSNVYTLDTSTGGSVFAVLYQCSGLAMGCSSCLAQRMGTDFQCGWCGSSCVDVSATCSTNNFVNESSNCPSPMITGISPDSGPTEGGTTLTINGTDLGTSFGDIVSITVGSLTCTPIVTSYLVGRSITCNIGSGSQTQGSVDVVITVSRMGGVNQDATTQFRFGQPRVYSVSPSYGPGAGGTIVRVRGEDLNIGNTERTTVSLVTTGSGRRRRRRQAMGTASCDITSISANEINCSWSNFTADMSGVVLVTVNSAMVQNNSVTYQYLNNPVYTGLTPQQTIRAGGIKLTFTGQYLNVSQQPRLQFNNGQTIVPACQQSSGTTLVCIAPPLSVLNSYTVVMDAAPGPDTSDNGLSLELVEDPVATQIKENSRRVDLSMNGSTISINGQRITNVVGEEITVMVGRDQCVVQSFAEDVITCIAPQRDEPVIESVTVSFGQNINNSVGQLEYFSQAAAVDIAPIAGGAAGGLILLIIAIFFICFIPIIVFSIKQSKQKDKKLVNLLVQMESMELEMADQCKQAFAELQTDLGELVAEDVLDKHHLPFHDFPTYAMRFLFPSADKNHPVLSPPMFPRDASNEQFTGYLEEFKELVFDKRFLFSFIRTLEAQQKFLLHDKCNVASLLLVTCQNDMPYVTEILMVLLKELIRRSISQSRSHPKLLLRRTECVAEKLLANWLCFLLYPHLLEHAGAPLFILYRAVKSQLEKCPVDVVTGEARNSLSEEKLLRQPLDFKVLECEVETGNHDEVLSIRLLNTDSISQAKEKILDLIYKNVPVSDRPRLDNVELELCRGNAGIPLRDQDATTRKEGEWLKINTLGYYGIAEMAEAAIEDPKKPTPRFRLGKRPERPFSGTSFDFPGTLVTSQSMTSQTSLLTSVQDGANRMHLYHLVKPEVAIDTTDGPSREGQKIMTEVFLTRLLSTKRILQDYVDTLFRTIFASPRAQSPQLPRAIKYLFDFLDLQAAELNITDHEVLHTWKTNSLPLRFWVNLIKNPEFLFDINKSATVDSCLTVIAQAYIDACSTSEFKYTKDTPSARLLYANEVKEYKEEVTRYYSEIQSQPHILPDEMNSSLKEATQVYMQGDGSHHFYADSALLELYRYASRYGNEISDSLSEDKLVLVAAQFNSLRQKFLL